MKIPRESEEVIYRNYLMEIYSKYWRELLAEPLVLQWLKSHSIKHKLCDLKKTIDEICKEKEIEDFEKKAITNAIENEILELAQEPANKLQKIRHQLGDIKIKIGEILVKEIILEGIEKELQGFGVKVLKLGPGEVEFIDKETRIVFENL